ncbi:MAG: response regulator [Mariprofundaceae bacterium]
MNKLGQISSVSHIQIQQSWFRLIFAVAGLSYLFIHGDINSPYTDFFKFATILYFIYNGLIILTIRRYPTAISRLLIAPLFDITVVALAMMVDGGQSSGLYLMFFIILFGNGLRFGNPMLLYSQAISLLGLNTVAIMTLIDFQIELDIALLVLQNIALIILPAYTYLISKNTDLAVERQQQAERTTFGLFDQGPLPAFTFLLDEHGMPRIQFVNHAMQDVYRNDVISLVGEQVDMITIMEDGNEIIQACQAVFNNPDAQNSHRFYVRGRNTEESSLQLMGQTMCMHWKNNMTGLCYLIDITQNETLRSYMAENMREGFMSTLVAGIVHDFRNILTGIIGTAEVLKFTAKDHQTEQQLDLIMGAGERGAELITNLLDINTKQKITPAASNDIKILQQSLPSILDLIRIQLPQHIQLHVEISDELPNINISPTQVEQIIINLVHNATYAISHTGCIKVILSSAEMTLLSDKKQPACFIKISDNGIGIAKEDLDFITKPFWTSHKDDGGSGLGLAMVQRLVCQHSGTLDIDSTLGKGTDIRILIPASKPINQTLINKCTNQDTDHLQMPKVCKILLVDDSPEVLQVHNHQLQKMGHQVITAKDGRAALKIFTQQKNEVDMIITDFHMPGMDGLDLALAIRKKVKNMPILIITAYGDDSRLQQTVKHHISLIYKPASYQLLANTISKMQKEMG